MQLSEAAQMIFKINECGLRIQSERPELFVMVRLVCFASGQTSPPRTTFRRELESAGCLSSAFIFQRLLLRLLKDICACDQAHPSQQQICRSSEFRPRVPASNDHSFKSTTSLHHYLGMRGFALLPINPGHKDIDCKKVFSSWPWRSIMNRFNEDVLRFLPGSRTGNGTMMKKNSATGSAHMRRYVCSSDRGGNVSISVLTISKNCQRIVRVLTTAVIILLPAAVFGQGYFGTVSGTLTRPIGGDHPGGRVTLLDEQKGYHFTAKSDSDGRYLFVSIPPGLYSVTAEMAGFEKTVRTHIKLNVSENATANLSLKIANASQSVEVRAQTTTIDTQDAVTGQVVDRRVINDLPLIDRNVFDLTYLAPGVTDMDDQCPNCGGTNFVSNGSRGASADILMDGASITNFEPNGGVTQTVYQPSAEAVEEFKVQQTNFSAEYGFSGASVINMVTRSGTNTFHGSAYDFIRNTITDANNWFNDQAGIPIPPVHRNDFGGTIGGPILKNKTFFFFDWDGTLASSMGTFRRVCPARPCAPVILAKYAPHRADRSTQRACACRAEVR